MNPTLRRATPADRLLLERLWLMFRHDLSEFSGVLPAADGTFRSERLDSALADPDWAAYVVETQDRPAGLALVRGLMGGVRVLNGFFVVRGARRTGIGLAAAQQVLRSHPGRWSVAFQDENDVAAAFWRRVAVATAGDRWTEELRPVPGRQDLPPDRWIELTAR